MKSSHLIRTIPILSVALLALATAVSANVVNIDFNNADADHVYSGQGAYADPGNDYWNAPSMGNGTPATVDKLLASDGVTLTAAHVSLTYTGNHERTSYNNSLLRDGVVHPSSMTIAGLDDNETYDIYFYSTFDAFATTFTVGLDSAGVSGSPDAAPYQESLVNGETSVVLSGLTPNGGEIAVTITNTDSGLGSKTFVTGLQIVGNIPLVPFNDTGVVNVDFGSDDYSGQGAHADPGNDFWNGGTGVNYSASNLLASDGLTTTSIAVFMPNGGEHTRASYSNPLLKDGLVTTGEGTMFIDNLDDSASYTLTLYGTFDEYSFDFTADGQTAGISGTPDAAPYEEGFINGQSYATLPGLQTNGSGTIEVTLTPTGTTGKSFITGFQIARESEAATSSLGRILCIGDSITESNSLRTPDGDGNWSWRYWFWECLVDFSIDHQFVGTRNSNKNGDSTYPLYEGQTFDKHHDSIWGTTALNRATNAPTYLGALAAAGQTPDTAVVFLGGNDVPVDLSVSAATVRDRIKTIVDNLQGDLGVSGNPDMRILLVSILPRFTGASLTTPDPRNATRFAELNDLLELLAPAETTATSEVIFLDLEELFSSPPGLLYDGTHPNGPGEQLAGNAIFAALVPDMPPLQIHFDSMNRATGQIDFRVRSHGPRSVRIDSSPDLSAASWTESHAPALNPGEWATMSVTEAPPLPARRFYRAVSE